MTAFFEDGAIYTFLGVHGMECRLYVNGQFQGIQEASFNTWNNGLEQFTFTGLDVDTNDDLDVDIWFWAIASTPGVASISAKMTYVAFTTD